MTGALGPSFACTYFGGIGSNTPRWANACWWIRFNVGITTTVKYFQIYLSKNLQKNCLYILSNVVFSGYISLNCRSNVFLLYTWIILFEKRCSFRIPPLNHSKYNRSAAKCIVSASTFVWPYGQLGARSLIYLPVVYEMEHIAYCNTYERCKNGFLMILLLFVHFERSSVRCVC